MDEEKKEKCCSGKKGPGSCGGTCGGFYFLTIIGSAVYFVQQAHGFWPDALGILKAIIWPAFLVYKVFVLLGI